jgi:hypothetical protein
MGVEVVSGEIAVHDLLAKEIGMEVGGLLGGIEPGEDLLRGIDPSDIHTWRDDLGKGSGR